MTAVAYVSEDANPECYSRYNLMRSFHSGEIPVRIGHGVNDYVYVDNLASAHCQCAEALADPTRAEGVRSIHYLLNSFYISFYMFCTFPSSVTKSGRVVP